MKLYFTSDLNPKLDIFLNNHLLFRGFAQDKFTVDCKYKKGKLKILMFDKDPKHQPLNRDKHVQLEKIKFDGLTVEQHKLYELFDPEVKQTKTFYLGFNSPDSLTVDIEHPHNKLIKRLALLNER